MMWKTRIGRLLCMLGLHKWVPVRGTRRMFDRYTEYAALECDRHCGVRSVSGERTL